MRFISLPIVLALLLQTATAAPAFDHAGISSRDLAEYYAGKRNEPAALGEYAKALAANPDDPLTYQSRGFYLLSLKRTEPALADFSKQISLTPREPAGYLNRGMLLGSMGREDDSTTDFATACALGSPDGCAWGKKPAER